VGRAPRCRNDRTRRARLAAQYPLAWMYGYRRRTQGRETFGQAGRCSAAGEGRLAHDPADDGEGAQALSPASAQGASQVTRSSPPGRADSQTPAFLLCVGEPWRHRSRPRNSGHRDPAPRGRPSSPSNASAQSGPVSLAFPTFGACPSTGGATVSSGALPLPVGAAH